MREVFLNLCILLAIDTTYNTGLFGSADFKAFSREFLNKFDALLQQDNATAMDVEGDELGDHQKDLLVSKVLEVIFEKKKNRIRILDGDL